MSQRVSNCPQGCEIVPGGVRLSQWVSNCPKGCEIVPKGVRLSLRPACCRLHMPELQPDPTTVLSSPHAQKHALWATLLSSPHAQAAAQPFRFVVVSTCPKARTLGHLVVVSTCQSCGPTLTPCCRLHMLKSSTAWQRGRGAIATPIPRITVIRHSNLRYFEHLGVSKEHPSRGSL